MPEHSSSRSRSGRKRFMNARMRIISASKSIDKSPYLGKCQPVLKRRRRAIVGRKVRYGALAFQYEAPYLVCIHHACACPTKLPTSPETDTDPSDASVTRPTKFGASSPLFFAA